MTKVLNSTDKHPEAYLRRAWLRYHQGRFADGLVEIELAQKAIRKVGKGEDYIIEDLLLAWGTLLYHTGDTKQALEKLDN